MLPLSFCLFGFHADASRKAFYFSWICLPVMIGLFDLLL